MLPPRLVPLTTALAPAIAPAAIAPALLGVGLAYYAVVTNTFSLCGLCSRVLVELSVLRTQLGLLHLTDRGASWLSVQREIYTLLSLERLRRLHTRGLIGSPMEPLPKCRMLRLGPFGSVRLPAFLSPALAEEASPMGAGKDLVFKDLVLVGGGHSHVHVLKMWGMAPEPGVQLTLVTRDVDTPYSGMLPGYVAGAYTWRECHIDLARLATYAGARLIHAEACGLDTEKKRLLLKGRPPLAYDVLSVDIGSAPKPVSVSPESDVAPANADAVAAHLPSITPVKPIDGFCRRWDAILERVLSLPEGQAAKIIVVGAGAGGVELALSMEGRLRRELLKAGRSASTLEVTLVGRNKQAMPQHAAGVREIFEGLLARRGIRTLLGTSIACATPTALHCDGGQPPIPYDEVIWCTAAGAQKW